MSLQRPSISSQSKSRRKGNWRQWAKNCTNRLRRREWKRRGEEAPTKKGLTRFYD